MDGARNQFLAGAGLAQNADAGFAGRNTRDLGHQFAHLFADEDDLCAAEFLAELAIFLLQAFQPKSVLHGEQ